MHRPIRALASFAVDVFYRVDELGEPVPASGPVVLVANHPNGLVDPILVARRTPRVVHFLGKAPLFSMPLLGPLVRGLRAIPVYRSRDGADPARNDEMFRDVFDALALDGVVCLFPEGTTHSEPALLDLRTGAARMALGAEARNDFGLGVQVVPVGLVYRDKSRFRSAACVWSGEPIDVRRYAARYAEDDREAVRELTEEIRRGLRSVTVELDDWADLPLVRFAKRLWRGAERSSAVPELQSVARALRVLREERPEAIHALALRVGGFQQLLDRLGLAPGDLDVDYDAGNVTRFLSREALRVVVGLPLFAAGAIAWGLPYGVVRSIPRWRPLEESVVATWKLTIAFFLFPLWLLLLTGVTWGLAGWLAALAVAVLAIPLGLFAVRFWEQRLRAWESTRVFLRRVRRAPLREELRARRDELAAELRALATELGDDAPSAPPARADPGGPR